MEITAKETLTYIGEFIAMLFFGIFVGIGVLSFPLAVVFTGVGFGIPLEWAQITSFVFWGVSIFAIAIIFANWASLQL